MSRNSDGKLNLAFREEILKSQNHFLSGSPILIITNIDNLETEYANDISAVNLGVNTEDLYNKRSCIFQQVLHPEDYPDYLEHLQGLKYDEEKEIMVRVKEIDGNWSDYCFKDHLYNWSSKGENRKAVLSLGFRLPELNIDDNEDSGCEEIPDKNPIPDAYEHLLNSIDESYCIIEMIFDRDGKPVDYLFHETNRAFEKQTNLTKVTGKTMREIAPNSEAHWFETYGKVALTGQPIRFQEQASYFDNSWLDVYSFKVGGDLSRKVAVLFHDITERKIAEETLLNTKQELETRALQRQEELSQNNDLLETVFDTVEQGIVVFKTLYEPNGDITDFLFLRINKVMQQMYGEIDPIGKTYSEITKYGVMMGIFDALKQVMMTGKSMDREVYFDKDGYNHWFRILARPQKNLLIASIEDITRQKQKAEKFKEAIRFKKQLIRTSPDTILIINLDHFNVRYINQDMNSRAGMTKRRIFGMSLTDILAYIHPRDREILIDFHKKILKSNDNEVFECEFRVKTKGSDWEWFSARGKIFNRIDENWVEEYVLLVRNITEQKNTQRALLNAERLSIQGEVARTFAHELRNPLASIRMASDVVKNKMDQHHKELLGSYIEILARSTRVLNNLVSNLLNSSNYKSGKLEKVDLAVCVDHTLNMAADRIYLTGIKVIKNYKGPYSIMADKEKLKIALLNLIVNASEATTPDEGIIEFTIKPHKTDYVLSIKDNGIGLEKEQIDKLFDAFYTNKATGVGIGLNSVKNILQDHDAQIKVSSEPNVGTTFNLFFPNADRS
ncbi:MAG TPA: ATP-binding protein [Gillisia sp.]|nr:ATP-binding protein [Gillisia sp.]